MLHPDGSSASTRYDKAGRVAGETSSTQATAGAGNTLLDVAYTYDVNGNRIGSSRTESLSAANRSAALSAHLPGGSNSASHNRTRVESWTYDAQDRLTSHTTPERRTTWQLDAGGRRVQQNVVATVGATGPPVGSPNGLETGASAPEGTLDYHYNGRDQLVQISGAASTSYTYDANGNRLTQAQTKGAVTSTTSYHWNAQDQLVRVEQDQGSGAQTLAQYRYNAGNLRAEKFLSNAGLNKATQGSAATYSPLAYERIQWDGLHARRSFEISGADNRQTLHSDTDAAVLAGNTAPWLFNRTQYANGLGSTSSTTQLHADSNGNLVATVASEGGTAKADSLLLYGAYGSVDSEASGNAGIGLKSNGNSFGSYYADPETGLLYARARYYDPASGQFISRDPVEGEARLPITWGAYQYGRYNPYRYTDPNGECDSWRDCGTKIAGGLVGGIGLTAVKAVEGTLDTARFIGDGYLGLFGSEAAQRRNSERLDLINGVIDNAGQLPSAVRQAIANIDEKAQAEDANGNTFTAAMLRGNYAGEIGLAIAGLPQAARSAASLADKGLAGAGNAAAKERVVARALARELQAAEPVLAAKAPEAPQVRTVDVQKDTTHRILKEPDTLTSAAKMEMQPASKTAGFDGNDAAPDAKDPTGASGPKNTIATASSGQLTELRPGTMLSRRQAEIHEKLATQGSIGEFSKKNVSMNDLRAIGQVTGDEYSMFTLGSRRLVIRGYGNEISVSQEMLDGLLAGNYGKWSGHTHPPGYSINPGPADRPFLQQMGQQRSAIWGDGGHHTFGQLPSDDAIIQSEIMRKQWSRIYGGN